MKNDQETLGPELGDLIRFRDQSMRRIIDKRDLSLQERSRSSNHSKAQELP